MKILSLFDGMANAQIAMLKANQKVSQYIAYEIDKYAIQLAKYNFPNIEHRGDVFDADFTEFENFDFLCGGSPCFVAGTMIYTDKGHKPIEDLKIGHLVLTHKNRFRQVTSIGSKLAQTCELRATGFLPTITTHNHPYFSRRKFKQYNPTTRGMIKALTAPKFEEVRNLTPKESHLGINQLTTSEDTLLLSNEDLWLFGRYVADGHSRISKRKHRKNSYQYQLVISVGSNKLDYFKSKITERHYFCYSHSQSVHRCVFSSEFLCRLVERLNFGSSAKTKNIPTEILNLPKNKLNIFLDGYFSGDGHIDTKGISCTTISRSLALTLPLAILKVYGVSANIHEPKHRDVMIIDGRTVNCNKQYVVAFKFKPSFATCGRLVDGQMWTPLKSIEVGEKQQVYNISVEEDESYTANNAIVHNCTHWSIAQHPDKREMTASGLGWGLFSQYLRALKEAKPKYFIYENNKSMSKDIRKSIDEAFGFEAVLINSALLSAQNRNRLYWVGERCKDGTYVKVEVAQPKDRGILLKHILDGAVAFDESKNGKASKVAQPIRVGDLPNSKGEISGSQSTRIYSVDAKSVTQCSGGGGNGTQTGLYAIPTTVDYNGKDHKVYQVIDGKIEINEKTYPIKLEDGYYIIRKLTVPECARLQTVPEWYDFSVISNSQAYKCLGNGWSVDVIVHLIRACLLD